MDRLLWMHCFVRSVETGSFTAVARELGIGQPNVSRHVASLEEYLGTRLLYRSTRKLTLTPEGERYFAETRPTLDAINEAESTARGENMPQGLLRVACAVSLGVERVVPLLRTFLTRYPKIDVELQISDRYIDLVEEGVDVAIRGGVLKDSALKARRIGTSERACVATPAYLAEYEAPKIPEDLLKHNCILYTLLATGNVWPFLGTDVAVQGRFRVNSPDGIKRAVLDSIGVGYVPVWLFRDELRDGRVQPLLLDFPSPPVPIHILYPAKRLLSQRASVFMDFVAESFAKEPTLNEGSLAYLLSSRM